MLKIKIICVGNLKEAFYRDAEAEFVKRLSSFCNLEIIEVREENLLREPDRIIEAEGKGILKHLSGHVICLDKGGKMFTSEEFSQKIEGLKQDTSVISFVIGGSYGISDEVKRAGESISFSRQTFTHNLFRIMLLEQIYRAFNISAGTKYHK